jgi:nucleotide-binding universal stress UspA family protein
MTLIVCATRGGEGSRAVQQIALQRAVEMNGTVEFLYVLDVDALEGVEDGLRTAVKHELRWLGETLLHLAKQRVDRADNSVSAEIVIREGQVRSFLKVYLRDRAADLLLLGAPRGTTANVFGDDEIEKFALEIQNDTGVIVEVVRPEDTE